MNYTKSSYMSYEELRISKLLSSLVSNKMLTAVRYCANASVYNPVLAVTELTTAQSIILALFYGLMSSDLKLCHFLQALISRVDQLKSSYLTLWLRDDYKFNTSDVYKVLSNLAHLIRGQHISLPDYVLRIFVGLNSKYGIIDICKANKDLEPFYFLLSVNVPCSRSQQTDKISLIKEPTNHSGEGPKSFQRSHSSAISNQSTMQSFSNQFSTCTDSRKPEVKPRNFLMKEPINDSDRLREPKSFQRIRSSSISNQSQHSKLSICTDTLKQEVEVKNSLKTKTRVPQPKENKSLAHAISIPNISELLTTLIKEPTNHSDERPKSFQRSHSSAISNQSTMQSFSNPFSTCTDSRKPEVKPRNSIMKEPINDSDSHREPKSFQRTRRSSISNLSQRSELSIHTDDTLKQEVELRNSKKSLAHAISTPNISELLITNDEMSAEAELVLSYLSKIGSTSVTPSHISHLVCKRDRRGGKSPLHLASRDGLLAVVKGLIKYGAPVNCRDDVGFTPAHYAAREGNIEILEVLKKHKADLTVVGDSGDTLLHLAARRNHAGTCGWLLNNLVLIDTQGYKGRTALHCAAMWGYIETVRLLLMRKASVQIKDYYHNTAYDLARSQGHSTVSNMLRNVM